jgi:RimJ/RimL family protein N-acetyltransferase
LRPGINFLGRIGSRREPRRKTTGLFVVGLGGAMIGQVILRRAKGHSVPAAAGQAELGYLFLPEAWGLGYAAEACAAALGWFAGELPGEPVVPRPPTPDRCASRRGWGSLR